MKLDTIKMLQEAFNVNEKIAKQLLETLDPILVARMISESVSKPVVVSVAVDATQKPEQKAKAATAQEKTKKPSQMELVRHALKSYSKGTPVTAADIAAATGISRKYASNYLWAMWK